MSKTPEPGEIRALSCEWIKELLSWVLSSSQHSVRNTRGPSLGPGLLREHLRSRRQNCYRSDSPLWKQKKLRFLWSRYISLSWAGLTELSWGVRPGKAGAGFHQPMMSGGYFVSLIILRMIMNVSRFSRDMIRSYFTPLSTFWSRPEDLWSIIDFICIQFTFLEIFHFC